MLIKAGVLPRADQDLARKARAGFNQSCQQWPALQTYQTFVSSTPSQASATGQNTQAIVAGCIQTSGPLWDHRVVDFDYSSCFMPRVLALDTATQACTLALSGVEIVARHEQLARAHNKHILQMLSELLQGRALAEAVDVIACGVGPGSFTGLRVAVSVAQGLAWARELPVHGFCSLTAQAYAAADQQLLQNGDWVLSTIDAQIGQLYGIWGVWANGRFEPRSDAFITPPEDLPAYDGGDEVVILGSAAHFIERFPERFRGCGRIFPEITPDARVMVKVLGTEALPLVLKPAHALAPQYVQREVGWKKLSEQVRHD